MDGVDGLAVGAGIDEHLVAGAGEIRRLLDGGEGLFAAAVAGAGRLGVDVVDHGVDLLV